MYTKQNLQGRLEIYKDYGNFVEKVGEYYNIVCRGMGITVAGLMTAGTRETKSPYNIKYAQVGTGVVDYLSVDSQSERRYNFFELASPISKDSYGKNLPVRLSDHLQLTVATPFLQTDYLDYTTKTNTFLEIPQSRVSIKKDTGISISLVLDKKTANGTTLTEIGLFSENGNLQEIEQSVLVVYKQFAPITKTSEFSIIFNWVINAVDFSDVSWEAQSAQTGIDAPTGNKGSGPGQNPPPQLSYGHPLSLPWLVEIGLPIETITPTTANIKRGTYGFVTAPSFLSINGSNGQVSANPGVPDQGVGFCVVSAQPSSTDYPIQQTRLYFDVSLQKGKGDEPDALFLGQIAWTVPSGAVLGTSTVINAVVPTSSLDFASSIWGAYNKWSISGAGTAAFNSSGFVPQTHNVVRDSSGGTETIEVIFPTTVVSAAGGIQYYDIFSASDSLPATTLSIPSYIKDNLYFYIKDLSGYQYKGDIWTGAATVSSIVKDGPYKRVYRFFTRMMPQSWATGAATEEKKPFGPSLLVFLTLKKDDPLIGLDFKLSNGYYDYRGIDAGKGIGTVQQNYNQVLGNFYYSDLWFDVSNTVSAVEDLERFSTVVTEDYFGNRDKYGLVKPEESIPEWVIRNTGTGGQTPLPQNFPFPGGGGTADSKILAFNIHGIGKTKKFHRRFRLFLKDNTYVTYAYAKETAQFGDLAFPNRIRTFWRLPLWGPTKDLAPLLDYQPTDQSYKNFNDTYFGAQIGDGTYDTNTAYTKPLHSTAPGMTGWNTITDNLYNYFEENTKYGICRYDDVNNSNPGSNYGGIGTRGINFINYGATDAAAPRGFTGSPTGQTATNYNYSYRTKCPHVSFGSRNNDIGGVQQIHLYKPVFLNNKFFKLLNAETHFVTERIFDIHDFSGVPINFGQVMNHYGLTSTMTGTSTIHEWWYPGYKSCRIVDDNTKPFFFPKIYGSKKTNSNLCEPYENDLINNITSYVNTNQYVGISTAHKLNSACKYAYYSMPVNGNKLLDQNYIPYRSASLEHTTRIYPLIHGVVAHTNDEMWKAEFEAITGGYSIAVNPYPSGIYYAIPTEIYTYQGTAQEMYNKETSLSDFYNVLKNNPSGRGTGAIGGYANVRGLMMGVAGPAMYYQVASDSWRQQNQLFFEYATSALYYSYIRENGLIGGLHQSKQTGADPNPQDLIDMLAAGHTFSSISTDPSKTYWYYNPSGKSWTDGEDPPTMSWEPPIDGYPILIGNDGTSYYYQGGIYDASDLWVGIMQAQYQVYGFRCLANSVKQFDSVIFSGLMAACSAAARTFFVDAFHIFSGCVGMPELSTIINNYNGGILYSKLNQSPGSTYLNILRYYTVDGTLLGELDTNKAVGGPPHFIKSNSNSWYYPAWNRGTDIFGHGNFTVGNTPRYYSGGDFSSLPLKSGFLRNDGQYAIAVGALGSVNNVLSALTSSNEILTRSAWFNSTYQKITSDIEPAKTAGDYQTILNWGIQKTNDSTLAENNPFGLFYSAPLIAYLQYVLGTNGNDS